jgi:hypothetical protein
VEKTTAWQSLEPAGLVNLANQLSALGDAGKGARDRLTEHVENKYLVEAATIQTVSLGDWGALVGRLAKDLPEQSRAAWAEKLYAAFTSDAAMAKLASADCNTLAGILQSLGSKQGPSIPPLWVEKTTAWQSLEPAGLVNLANQLSALGDAGKGARARLTVHVENKYLVEAATIQTVSLGDWGALVGRLAKDLPEPSRAAWAEKLYAAFTSDAALAKLCVGDCNALAGVLKALGSERDRSVLPLWVEKTTTWQTMKAQDFVNLANRIARLGDAGKDARARLIGRVEKEYLASEAALVSVSCAQWWDLVRSFAKDLSPDTCRSWVGKLRAAYVDDARTFAGLTSTDVTALSEALKRLGDPNGAAVITQWLEKR